MNWSSCSHCRERSTQMPNRGSYTCWGKKKHKQSFFVCLVSLLPQQWVLNMVVAGLDLAQRWANKNWGSVKGPSTDMLSQWAAKTQLLKHLAEVEKCQQKPNAMRFIRNGVGEWVMMYVTYVAAGETWDCVEWRGNCNIYHIKSLEKSNFAIVLTHGFNYCPLFGSDFKLTNK